LYKFLNVAHRKHATSRRKFAQSGHTACSKHVSLGQRFAKRYEGKILLNLATLPAGSGSLFAKPVYASVGLCTQWQLTQNVETEKSFCLVSFLGLPSKNYHHAVGIYWRVFHGIIRTEQFVVLLPTFVPKQLKHFFSPSNRFLKDGFDENLENFFLSWHRLGEKKP
jgi:hypothetical protein